MRSACFPSTTTIFRRPGPDDVTQIVWVDAGMPLPDARRAGVQGLLAAGADLSVARLEEAYTKGIFPWFNEGDPVLWWSPDPRMVLACDALHISRSLDRRLRRLARAEACDGPHPGQGVSTNLAFDAVMGACAQAVPGRELTWISADMRAVYGAWHRAGRVHSVEVWQDGVLAGGLYGVCLGRMFFGESMFSRMPDASKLALVYLVRHLQRLGIAHIDCQQETPHLASLGAQPMARLDFLALLQREVPLPSPSWGRGWLLQDGRFAPGAAAAR